MRRASIGVPMLALILLWASDRAAAVQDTAQAPSAREPLLSPVSPYRLDGMVADRIAWLTPAIQTAKPLTSGVDHVHIADASRRWAAAIPVPTRIPNAIALSPNGEHLAIVGPVGEINVSKPIRVSLVIVRLRTGEIVYTRPDSEGVTELSWVGDHEFLVLENTTRFKVGPAKFVLRLLTHPEGIERQSTSLPEGRRIHRFVPDPSGTRVALVESDGSFVDLQLAIVDLPSGRSVPLTAPKGLVNPSSLSWWPDGQALYTEIGGAPWRISTSPDRKSEIVTSGIPELEGLELEGALSPNGEFLLAGALKAKTLFLLNLKTRSQHSIGTCELDSGPLLRNVAWSKSGSLVGGWLGIAQRAKDSPGGVLSWTPFVLNLANAKLATYRVGDRPHPLFLIETQSVVDSIQKRAKPWQ